MLYNTDATLIKPDPDDGSGDSLRNVGYYVLIYLIARKDFVSQSLRDSLNHICCCIAHVELGREVDTVTDCGLDSLGIEVQFRIEARDFFFSSQCVDRLWGPPGLLFSGYRELFPRV
jgi:hypothetical protein